VELSIAIESECDAPVAVLTEIERGRDAESFTSAIECEKRPSYDFSLATESGTKAAESLPIEIE
jgi:hypothetical protein